jgi:hypothetical protein
LDDETKRAAVIAAADIGVERRMGEIQAERGAGRPGGFAGEDPDAAPPSQSDDFLGGVELYVDHIRDGTAVHFEQPVARTDADFGRRAPPPHGGHQAAGFLPGGG